MTNSKTITTKLALRHLKVDSLKVIIWRPNLLEMINISLHFISWFPSDRNPEFLSFGIKSVRIFVLFFSLHSDFLNKPILKKKLLLPCLVSAVWWLTVVLCILCSMNEEIVWCSELELWNNIKIVSSTFAIEPVISQKKVHCDIYCWSSLRHSTWRLLMWSQSLHTPNHNSFNFICKDERGEICLEKLPNSQRGTKPMVGRSSSSFTPARKTPSMHLTQ